MQIFFDSYLKDFCDESIRVLDVGSQVVDEDARSYKQLLTGLPWAYTGLDISPGRNVDVCVKDPYVWPELASDSFDVVISGQTFEHVPYFWTLAYEMGRVVRPGGLICVIAPSGGHEHRYPVDCWRFYPDGFASLSTWLRFTLMDSHTDWSTYWGDSVLVLRKPHWSPSERAGFEHRWRVLMSLMPAEMNTEIIQFDSQPTDSLIKNLETRAIEKEGSRRYNLFGKGFNQIQKAALAFVGPSVTRSLAEMRNRLRGF